MNFALCCRSLADQDQQPRKETLKEGEAETKSKGDGSTFGFTHVSWPVQWCQLYMPKINQAWCNTRPTQALGALLVQAKGAQQIKSPLKHQKFVVQPWVVQEAQPEDPSRASLGSSAVEPAFDWDENGAVWPLTEDTGCSGRGALIAKAECGTTLKAPGALREESVPSQSEEDVFSNVDDPSAIDPDSDWKAPTEEWGNWTGDEEHQTGAEKEKDLPKGKAGIHFCLSGLESKTQRKKKKIEVREAKGGAGLRHPQQGLETRIEGGPRDLVSTKHRSDAVCASFKKSLDVANNSPNNEANVYANESEPTENIQSPPHDFGLPLCTWKKGEEEEEENEERDLRKLCGCQSDIPTGQACR
ncbi:hypothetical protein Q9233_011057 [Columba guinea]|nr:hypothetical protein Q9233_011057 [Columba guinea]